METMEQLWQAYQEWRNLTHEEGAAIQSSQWTQVHKAQTRKRALQGEIIRLTGQIHNESHSKGEQKDFELRLRKLVNELILLETQNNLNIQTSIDTARDQKQGLEFTSSRLRQVHSRYVPPRAAVWENLS